MDSYFDRQLAKAVQAKNITSKQLAGSVGINPSDVSRFQSGEKLPTLPVLNKIAKELDTPICYFFEHKHECCGQAKPQNIHIASSGTIELAYENHNTKTLIVNVFLHKDFSVNMEEFLFGSDVETVHLIQVTKGSMTVSASGEKLVLKTNEKYTFSPNACHGIYADFSEGTVFQAVILGNYTQVKTKILRYAKI